MKRILLPLTVLAIAIATSPASAGRDHRQTRYVGIHPIPKAQGSGICHIEYPHVHVYAPTDQKVHYRDHDGDLYFVGDPVAYGWDGPRHGYRGPHPIRVDVVVGDDHEDTEYCYLDGPHYHGFEPAPVMATDFRLEGGVYWYVGAPTPAFIEARPVMAKVNAYYTPIRYERPVVTIEAPPPGWIGVSLAIVPPAAVVQVRSPEVVVVPPPPVVVQGGIGFDAHVGIALPSVDLHIGGPAVVVGGGSRTVIRHDHGKHRGRHKGRHR